MRPASLARLGGRSPYSPLVVISVVRFIVEVSFAVGSRQDTSTTNCLVVLFMVVTVRLAWLWGRDPRSELENELLVGRSANDRARAPSISVWAMRRARSRCLLSRLRKTVLAVAWKMTKVAAISAMLITTSISVEPELFLNVSIQI